MLQLDRVSLGLYIRKLRKKKNLTQQELSSGIFSVSKMSYIENGTGTLSEEELKELCKKLDISYNLILNELNPKVEDKDQLEELESHLFLGFYSSVELKLNEIEAQISLDSPSNNIDIFKYLYLRGRYYYSTNQTKKSIETLISIEKKVPIQAKNVKYLHRAYNLLSTIYFEKDNFSDALGYIEKALNFRNDEEELLKTEFNAAILYALEGEYRMSKAYINRINKKKDYLYLTYCKTKYLLFVLDILEGDIKKPSDFNELLNVLRESKEYELIARMALIQWHLNSESRSTIEKTFDLELNLVIGNKQMSRGYEKVLLNLLHSFIYRYYDEENYETSLKYIEKAYILKDNYPNLEDNFYTYLLHAKILSCIDPEIPSKQIKLYFKALSILQNSEILSYSKGLIHYELSKLIEEPIKENKHQHMALESIYYSTNTYFKRINVFSYFLPRFIY